MKVACYLRVSTEQQTVDNQRADVETWLKSHNVGPDDITYYAENESAWKVGHQKELARLLSDLRTGRRKYDVALVWALDRLTRQGIGTILQLINSFKVCGCRVCSIKESFLDVDSSFNEVFTAFIAWAAKYESDRKSERVKAAHARLRLEGKHIGRPMGSKDKPEHPRRKSGYYERWSLKKNE
jgi:DNA invertase Pin-like site-specific DNA recombinase